MWAESFTSFEHPEIDMIMIKKAIPMLLLLTIACRGPKQGQDESNSSNSIKPVEELSYREIVASVMSEHGEPLEYHGEPTKEEGLEDVTSLQVKSLVASQTTVSHSTLKIMDPKQ